MKKVVLALLLLTLTLSAENRFTIDEPFLQQDDKKKHIAVCAAISATTSLIAYEKYSFTKYEAMFIGFVAGMVVGVGKEISDDNFDNQDIKADIIGSAIGTAPVFIIYEW